MPTTTSTTSKWRLGWILKTHLSFVLSLVFPILMWLAKMWSLWIKEAYQVYETSSGSPSHLLLDTCQLGNPTKDMLYMIVGLEGKEPASIFCQRGQLKLIHQSVGVTTTTVILLILISTTTIIIINVEELLLSHSSVVSTDSRWRRGCTSDGREMTVRFYDFFRTVGISKNCFLRLWIFNNTKKYFPCIEMEQSFH